MKLILVEAGTFEYTKYHLKESRKRMPRYHVGVNGSNTAPFNTVASAAINFTNLVSTVILQDGDVIEVLDGGIIYEGFTISIGKRVTIRSYPGNQSRPIIKNSYTIINNFNFISGSDGSIINGIDFLKNNDVFDSMGTIISIGFNVEVNDITIEKCKFSMSNSQGAYMGMAAIRFGISNNIKIKNCLFNDVYSPIMIMGELDSTLDRTGIEIINNTFYNINHLDYWDPVYGGVVGRRLLPSPPYGDVELYFYNNIIDNFKESSGGPTQYEAIAIKRMDSGFIDANIFDGVVTKYNVGVNVSVIGANNLEESPLLIDPPNDDFKISLISPCIDSGVGVATYSGVPMDDIEGIQRPIDIATSSNLIDGTDMGAHERLPVISSLNVGSTIDVTGGGVDVESTLNAIALEVYALGVDENFLDSSEWDTVSVIYEHSSGQKLVLPHRFDGSEWTASGTFLDIANDGAWLKNRVIIFDKMGDYITVEREDIGTGEDLTVIAPSSDSSSLSVSSELSFSSVSSASSESSESSDSSASGGGVPAKLDYYFRMRTGMTGTFISVA